MLAVVWWMHMCGDVLPTASALGSPSTALGPEVVCPELQQCVCVCVCALYTMSTSCQTNTDSLARSFILVYYRALERFGFPVCINMAIKEQLSLYLARWLLESAFKNLIWLNKTCIVYRKFFELVH